ncbi:major facilitator superfamily domain-containing protein [Powellomyces hirtus]|nr:major facilitator superfamily domain-containing protein [Powellomyces hirtus]
MSAQTPVDGEILNAEATEQFNPQHLQPTSFLRIFKLNPGVTALNFVVYLIAASLGICFFVFINSSQGFVLGDIIRIPSSELGTASGSLTFYDELVSIVAVYLWGLASDRIGRRAVYGAGFFIMAIGLAGFTFPTKLYPDLLLVRLVFAVGGAASSAMMTGVLADYAAEESRGKVSGLVGLVSGCGALIALFVLLRLPPKFGDGTHGLRVTFFITAGISVAAAVLMWTALQSSSRMRLAVSHSTTSSPPLSPISVADSAERNLSTEAILTPQPAPASLHHRKPLKTIAKEGILAGRDLRILLGYAGSFLARGDTIILTLFLPLWVYKYYLDSGMCTAPGGPEDPDIKTHCREAYLKASVLSGIAQTFALIGAPIFGYLTDRFYRPFPILFAGLLGVLSYALVHMQSVPTQRIMFLYMILIGFAEIGLVVGSLALVTATYVPAHIRGSVAGMSSLFGAAGILLNTRLGGALFDSWVSTAPFFIMAILHVVFCLVAVAVVAVDYRNARRMLGATTTDEPREVSALGPPAGTPVLTVMRREFEKRAVKF